MGEFASKGVAGSGLGLGIAGTALGVLASSQNGNGGILGGLFGNNGYNDKITGLMTENSLLKAENYSDKDSKEVYNQTVKDNKELADRMLAYITPIANEVSANKTQVAVLESQMKCENEKSILREQLARAEMENKVNKDIGFVNGRIDRLGGELNAKIDNVANTCGCGISQLNNAVAAINTTLGNITKTIVPKDAICPEFMNRYNSWAAPAAGS